ncbi:flavin reductase family protein [Parasphingorhabdus sp.]|uniref:flavin reductase family protein n=1 Tax=Parasphingorhabdus sp. TaxID=2709688 RepID=UPI0032EC2C48
MAAAEERQRDFRNALSSFATGVTIATTKDAAGQPIGVTASSFNSVSLDPPLVLWSLAKKSHSFAAFSSSGHFAVHVLAATQEDLSNRFARSGQDKFGDLDWRDGPHGSPVLGEHAALFQCLTRNIYEGGDHVIIVGEVMDFEARNESPLLFHGGSYAERRQRPGRADVETVNVEAGSFSDGFLFYLITRAHYQTSKPIRDMLQARGSSMTEYLTMALLSMEAPLAAIEVERRLAHTGHAPSADVVQRMVEQDLVIETESGFILSAEGREQFVETLAYGKAFEDRLADHLTAGEIADTKQMLRLIIDLSGKDVPISWRGTA